jgi:YbgC/YbaW family acyl-CoA thioester hydrolase
MAFTTRIKVRFSDVDWARVVYFARYFDFCHRAVEAFFDAQPGLSYAALLEQRQLGFPIVHSEASFFGPLRLADTARVEHEVIALSERSVTSRFTIFRNDSADKCAVIQLKQAAIDTTVFKGIPLPADVHAALKAHLA